MISRFLSQTRHGCESVARRLAKWGVLSALVLAGAAPFGASAEGCYDDSGFVPFTVTLPMSGTVVVPRDIPVGTELARFSWVIPTTIKVASCVGTFTTYRELPVTPYTPAVGGIYPTNIPGVGVKVTTLSGAVFPLSSTQVAQPGGIGLYLSPPGHGVAYVFIKTGPTASGTVTNTDVPVARYNPGFPGYDVVTSGSVTFLSASCVTPDVLVNLGRHQTNVFTGINATSPTVDFNIKLNSCPAGMNLIKYRIDPATTVTIPAQSVVALDATSTATGVGVQLLDGGGAVHPLGAGTDRTFGGYNATTGGSYTIPLKARYYQTGPTVTPGQANTTMTFTMTYL